MDKKLQYKKAVIDAINRVYANGLTSTSGGNISAIDGEGNVYITPSSVDKGTLKTDDIMVVDREGRVFGRHTPSIELPFHRNTYAARLDVGAVLHAHAPAVVACTLTDIIPDFDILRCYDNIKRPICASEYELPGSLELGDIVRDKFNEGYDYVMMDNHGATVVGKDLKEAYMRYEALDILLRTSFYAKRLGGVKKVKRVASPVVSLPYIKVETGEKESKIRKSIVAFLRRSYRQGLMASFFGTIAVKTEDGFIMNADNDDRGTLTARSLIKVTERGVSSRGKASIYIPLIKKIFAANAEANCVFISMPPALMGFALSGRDFDSRIIPESYIMLKKVSRLPYGSVVQDTEKVAAALTKQAPAALVDNECAVTIGKNITKAFDRMEVLEFSARSIITADGMIGKSISKEGIEEIDVVFNGW